MPAQSRPVLSSLSLLAAMGPVHRSSLRFDKENETPPAVVPPVAAPALKLTPLQRMKAMRASLAGNQTLAAQLVEQRTQVAALTQQLTDMTTSRDGLQARITVLEGEATEAAQLMEAMLEENADVHRVAGAKAAAIAAGQGIPERELPQLSAEGGNTKERSAELLKEYQKLSTENPTQAAAFHAKHEKEMLS